jgi:2,5-diamino-6-(ribosylamino)-4(3H)-pyrimidinone 5'-phosphate reductase
MTPRPFVIINVAVSADGKTDTIARQGADISSRYDRERVDRLRANSDAVMVGGRTILGDDPRLTVKSAALRAERRARGLDENPIKVGVLSSVALPLEGRFLSDGPARIMLFTTQQSDPASLAQLREHGVQVFVTGERRVDVVAALEQLWKAGVRRLLAEGGGTLNAELLRLRLVDELYVYVAPLLFGGATAPTFVDGPGWEREAALELQLVKVERLADAGFVVQYGLPHD